MKRLRRAVQTSANANATTGPFTDTRLLIEGHSTFSLRFPTGPALVSFDQHDRVSADSNQSGDGTTQDSAGERIFRQAGFMSEHIGPTPTIVTIDADLTAGQKSGIVRAWTCATPDKQNGLWAEVESVTDRPTGPEQLSTAGPFVSVNSNPPVTTSAETDPGYQTALEHYPAFGVQSGRYVFRPTRIRFGYVVDGEETVQGDFWDPQGVYPLRWTLELACDPLGLEEGTVFDGHQNFASVVFQLQNSSSTATRPLFAAEPEQYKFSFDVEAVSKSDLLLQERKNLVEWLPPRTAGPHTPWGVLLAQQKTAVDGGYSLCLPQIPAGPTGIKVVRPVTLVRPSSSPDRYYTWAGQSTEDVPGPTYAAPLAVKDGPSWHGQSLVPIGTTRGVDYDRHRLEFVFPTYSSTLISSVAVTYAQNPFFFGGVRGFSGSATINLTKHLAVAASGQTINLESSIGDRQLIANTFYFHKEIPTLSLSRTSSNSNAFYPAGVPYEYDVDFVLSGSARAVVDRTISAPVWTNTFPWPSLAAANAAGVTDDEFWYLQTTRGRGDLQKIAWTGTFIQMAFHAAVKITVRQIGAIACSFVMYRRQEGSLRLNLTPDQCRGLGNGQTVDTNVTNFVSTIPGFSNDTSPAAAAGQLRLL